MSNSIDSNAFDRVTDPVFKLLSRDQVTQLADYHSDESLQQRIAELAEKANEGNLPASMVVRMTKSIWRWHALIAISAREAI